MPFNQVTTFFPCLVAVPVLLVALAAMVAVPVVVPVVVPVAVPVLGL